MSLAEYLCHLARARDSDAPGDQAVLDALDALRLGVAPPTLRELADSAHWRRVWIEASRLLEHERATRHALALSSPGVRLEDAVRGYDSEEDAITAAILAHDARLVR